VGALAAAAARLDERRAVPLLVAHLDDPNTRAEDLGQVAAALSALGEQSAAEPMADLLWLYHAEATDEAFAGALAALAQALISLQGPVGRDTVQELVDAPFTAPPLRAALSDLLSESEEAGAEGSSGEDGDAASSEENGDAAASDGGESAP